MYLRLMKKFSKTSDYNCVSSSLVCMCVCVSSSNMSSSYIVKIYMHSVVNWEEGEAKKIF